MATWLINGSSPESLGLEMAGGTFRTAAPSEMTLRRVGDFTAASPLAAGAAVVVTRDGTAFFRGRVAAITARAAGNDEGHDIVVIDAWRQLEETIYEEPWPVGVDSVFTPVAVLGIKSDGTLLTDSQQIGEALEFAEEQGLDIQAGSLPTGLPLWPSEIRNTTIAEVIRLSLRFHPDWIPWLDYSTSPATLNVTPAGSMTTQTIAISSGDVAGCSLRRRDDLKLDAVKLTYLTATIIDGVTYRDFVQDHYPPTGPEQGPKVLSTCIELAGGQMQFQKSRIRTKTIPSGPSDSAAKAFLKANCPELANVPDSHFTVSTLTRSLVPDDGDHAPAINPNATRLSVSTVSDLPRQLTHGSVEDWMRVRVGRVNIAASISATGGASDESKAAIAKARLDFSVTATNATTKIYKGITQWVAPEAAPEGIAEAVYNASQVYQYDGSVTTVLEDISGTRYHGAKLNVTGGPSDWATMGAMVHSVTYDLKTGSTTIQVGPAPFLSADSIIEMQRLIRGRAPTWMSAEERVSNELGATNSAGSKGDTVSPYDFPQTIFTGGGEKSEVSQLVPVKFRKDGGTWKVTFSRAEVIEHSLHNPGKQHTILSGDTNLGTDPELDLTTGSNQVWLAITVAANGTVGGGSCELSIGEEPESKIVIPQRPNTTTQTGTHVQLVGTITVAADADPVWRPNCTSTIFPIFLPTIDHVGAGVNLFRAHINKVDYFKRIRSAALSESEEEDFEDSPSAGLLVESESDEIKLRKLIFRGGGEESPGVSLLSEETENAVAIRGIKGADDEVILISADEDEMVKIEAVGLTRNDDPRQVAAGVNVRGGIVKSFTGVPGKDLALKIWWSRFDTSGNIITPSPQEIVTLYFYAGIFIGTEAPDIDDYDPIERDITWVTQGT